MIRIRMGMMVIILSLGARVLAAQQPGPPRPHANAGRMGDTMMAQGQEMRMMDSMTTRLDSLVRRMNRTSGNTKVAAMADVINELVAQRKAMHARMTEMMESRRGMMKDMMGGQPEGGQPVPRPPAAPDSSAADSGHAGHHPPS